MEKSPREQQVFELEDGWDLLTAAVRVEGAGAQEWTPWRNPQTKQGYLPSRVIRGRSNTGKHPTGPAFFQ